jgi:hypothetical protein
MNGQVLIKIPTAMVPVVKDITNFLFILESFFYPTDAQLD